MAAFVSLDAFMKGLSKSVPVEVNGKVLIIGVSYWVS